MTCSVSGKPLARSARIIFRRLSNGTTDVLYLLAANQDIGVTNLIIGQQAGLLLLVSPAPPVNVDAICDNAFYYSPLFVWRKRLPFAWALSVILLSINPSTVYADVGSRFYLCQDQLALCFQFCIGREPGRLAWRRQVCQ